MSTEVMARKHYEDGDTVRRYGARSELLPAETGLLSAFADQIAGARILDIGCGGGRTSATLARLGRSYVGIDYAAPMVEICRRRYPSLDFRQADATRLDGFADASFDFVLFSYNGIDTMSHSMRLAVFAAVQRILAPEGSFAFSSHNRDYRHIVRGFDRQARLGLSSIRQNAWNILSHLRVRHLERFEDEYAILSDPRAGYCQLSYFITKHSQIAQLQAHGFVDARVIDWEGALVSPDDPDGDSMSFYYMCRKPASQVP